MLRNSLLLLCCFFFTAGLSGQGKARSFQLKKGQVLDFLFLRYADDTVGRKKYFAEVYPVGLREGYQPGPGFAAREAATQGNFQPEFVVLGGWPDRTSRESASIVLEEEVDDFHGQRRRVWSYFGVRYFELTEDLDLRTDPSKYYVITTCWAEEAGGFDRFRARWEKQQKRYGGLAILTLDGGYSPQGYLHDPDYLTITEWASEADFRAFLQADRNTDRTGVLHLNQFRIQ